MRHEEFAARQSQGLHHSRIRASGHLRAQKNQWVMLADNPKTKANPLSQVPLSDMSELAYNRTVKNMDKPLAWLHGEVKTPPLSHEARIETGFLLRRLQRGERLQMPQSRPMPGIGARCHELRINDADVTWRLIYRIDPDAIVIADVFAKKTHETPKTVIQACKRRLKEYDDA